VTGAHRISWEIHHGPIPPGMFVCHRCDNPGCVNPGHLFVGAPKANTQDMIKKGRAWLKGPGFRFSRAQMLHVATAVIPIGQMGHLCRELGISRSRFSAIRKCYRDGTLNLPPD
jgi:hypothetical protein